MKFLYTIGQIVYVSFFVLVAMVLLFPVYKKITPSGKIIQPTSVSPHQKSPVVISKTPVSVPQVTPSISFTVTSVKTLDYTIHNTTADCYVKYNGHIYNISSYLSSHPGGAEIIVPFCGKDITTAFNTKGKNPPKQHSSFAVSQLNTFLVQ